MREGALRRLLCPEKLIVLLLLVLLAERIALFWQFGVDYLSYSDDHAYLAAGLLFAKTGMISMWGPYPSAMIMPGMPAVIGAFSLVFGEGSTLLLALKLLWILMGVATAHVAYKTAELAAGGWAGLFAACGFLVPNMAWMNHVLLTETPYMLFFSLCLYLTLRLERGGGRGCRIGYVLGFMAALMFRANIVLMPVFTAVWLLLRRQGRQLLRLAVPLLCAFLLFVIPWSLRNYRCFDAFIPLTYGAGNPLLLGTYQGEGYPEDDVLDYESNVHEVMHERYAARYKVPEPRDTDDYYTSRFDPDGEVRDLRYAQYLSLTADGVMVEAKPALASQILSVHQTALDAELVLGLDACLSRSIRGSAPDQPAEFPGLRDGGRARSAAQTLPRAAAVSLRRLLDHRLRPRPGFCHRPLRQHLYLAALYGRGDRYRSRA